MDPISLAAGAVPMVSGLLDKGMDLIKGGMDLAGKLLDKFPDAAQKPGDTGVQSQAQITYD
ncbi:hypothetical protein HX871_13270 [Pseudomonas reactans]|uniref:Uncharacterized protein n=1 Tax=Pseudomonas reactans TaxID=117680 RepID=A0ABX2QUE3_9PSED|nr:hypothetical protein [Pseudomonas reactans]NWA36245.1 hypothetical protein [Pseudomonas reactans]NWA69360.1 hypothetical protein [Pseudomonas reactans]NWC89563.1 hypothetical protein [Pseudomonas reactans]NWD28587.1 hypothetical protein [Pseudomonas reactans]NWD95393.1 hypothetical protein [Pseudomonas reactans]